MRELFIYYQIPAAKLETARAVVESFQERLRQRHPGLTARLLRRPGPPKDLQTWMEVYALSAGAGSPGITEQLEAEIGAEARGLDALMSGPRHVEAFVPCAS